MKTDPAVGAAWCAVAGTDPASLDRDAVARFLRSIASVRAVCDAAEILAVRRTRELATAGAAESAENLLASETGRSSKDAREAAAREEACAAMPELEASLAAGTMSAGHVDAAALAHSKLPDDVADEFAAHADSLAARSRQLGVDAFERECRDLARHLTAVRDANAEVDELERQKAASSVKRWVDKLTGMHKTLISLDPVRDAKMWKVLNNQVKRENQKRTCAVEAPLPFAALQAQAVVNAVTETANANAASPAATSGPVAGGRATPEPCPGCASGAAAIRLPEISILCGLDTLVSGIRAIGEVCESDDGVAIPPDTVRRLACDAKIIPVLLGTDGEVLDQGRKARTATPAQRNALAAMHRGCAYPSCTVGFSDSRIHHIRWWWEHYGRTDIDNLLPLCEQHHHLVHEGGWGLTLDAARTAIWTRPDGSIHYRGTTINRGP